MNDTTEPGVHTLGTFSVRRWLASCWQHPVSGEPTQFAVATIGRWYLTARNALQDPVAALRRKIREDAGRQRSIGVELRRAVQAQYEAHPSWCAQLHYDNLGTPSGLGARMGRVRRSNRDDLEQYR